MLAGALALTGLLQTATAPAFADPQGKTSTTTASDVKKEWAEALGSIKGYSETQRDKALEEANSLIKAMDDRIEALETRAEDEWKDLGKDARSARQEAMKTLRQQRAELSEWYGGMKHSSTEAWEDVKSGFVDGYGELEQSFAEAAKEF